MSPAQTGGNPEYATIARNSKGKGSLQKFDYDWNSIQDLRGIWFKLYVNKPD